MSEQAQPKKPYQSPTLKCYGSVLPTKFINMGDKQRLPTLQRSPPDRDQGQK